MTGTSELSESTAVALGIATFVVLILVYVWTSLALAALFRKCGVEGWKGWVPVLNQITLLQIGGLSGWFYLLVFVPPGLFVVSVIACYRISKAFGFGVGMTILSAIALPVWASILGFGSARWVGAELRTGAGPVRTGTPAGDLDSAEPTFVPSPTPRGRSTTQGADAEEPLPWTDWAAPATPARSTSAVQSPPASASAVPPVPPMPPVPPRPPRPAWASDADLEELEVSAIAPVGFTPTSAFARSYAEDDETDGIDDLIAPTVHPAPPAAEPAPVTPATPIVEATQVAAPIAQAPVTGTPAPTPETAPMVTQVPAAAAEPLDEPWAPRRSAMPLTSEPLSDESFSDTSGEVSAVAGAPDAGAPRSALASVSALYTRAEPADDDAFDDTVITRRRRAIWSLVPPIGAPIEITEDVVILGRRPDPDSSYPRAQLIPIVDDTRTVSKTHARLELHGENWMVTDLGSTNGVLLATLMGTEVEAEPGVELAAGERFFLGDAEVRLQRSDP
ncbi:DUF5684 domain-containing protein [Microbacterium lacus]|uniref:DUF5684 domain-containing protein n=1 Tax=Microbacterium lacus TaxID=415217 RepID=UPI00384EEA73